MLETGAIPAVLRAELLSNDGSPIGFDFALLPPEGVARVADQGGDDFTLEWPYCGGHGKAVCFPARGSSIRVLWEPSLFPDLMPNPSTDAATDPQPAPQGTGGDEKSSNPGVGKESFPFKKQALIDAHIHQWPAIKRDIKDAARNGLAAARAGSRGWREDAALTWARTKGRLTSVAKPADNLTQAMHNLSNLPNSKHRIQR